MKFRKSIFPFIPLVSVLTVSVANAQSGQYLHLNPGDTLTVSTAGTIGTVGGSPFASPTSSYTGYGFFSDTVDNYGNFTLASGGSLNNPETSGKDYGISTMGNGKVTMTGGSVTVGNGNVALGATDSSSVNITGGTLTAGSNGYGVFADGGNFVKIAGGVFTVGQGGIGLDSSTASTIDLFGTNFAYTVNGVKTYVTQGVLPSNGFRGVLTGTFLNGDNLNTTFFNDSVFEVNVGTPPPAAVPEASTTVSLGLLLALGLGGFVVAKKRVRNVA